MREVNGGRKGDHEVCEHDEVTELERVGWMSTSDQAEGDIELGE